MGTRNRDLSLVLNLGENKSCQNGGFGSPDSCRRGHLRTRVAQPILRGRQRRAGGNCADASRWLRLYVRLRSTIGRNLEFRATGALEVQGGASAYASIELPSLFGDLHFLPGRPGASADLSIYIWVSSSTDSISATAPSRLREGGDRSIVHPFSPVWKNPCSDSPRRVWDLRRTFRAR